MATSEGGAPIFGQRHYIYPLLAYDEAINRPLNLVSGPHLQGEGGGGGRGNSCEQDSTADGTSLKWCTQ